MMFVYIDRSMVACGCEHTTRGDMHVGICANMGPEGTKPWRGPEMETGLGM